MSDPPGASGSQIVLTTDRLALRHFLADDTAFIVELLNEPSFVENIGDKGVRNEADARRYLIEGPLASYEKFGFGLYRVELAEGGQVIGMCGLIRRQGLDAADVGFAFLPRFWSKGYATESAAAVLDYGRQALGLGRLLAITSPSNLGSQRVLEKVGFRLDRVTRLPGDPAPVHLFVCEDPSEP